jgi:MFS family permease
MILIDMPKRMVEKNFHALTHKNFRYYWLGQCVSLIGTWMQNIGQSWLVLTLTGSPFLLGVLGMVQFLPIMIFSLFAGVIVDRFPKKRILLVTQTISMVLAFILAFMVFTHTVRFSYILVLALVLGCTNTIDMPTRQAFTVEIAGREDLMNAIALNSAIFNLARILGPAIGAALMAWLGAGWCFILNGLSFIAVIFGIFHIEVKPYVRKKSLESSILHEIKDGLIYVAKTRVLLQTVLMVTVIGIFAFNYNVLVPSFTREVLHQSEKTYGFLMSALGIGSLLGAITVSARGKKPKMKVIFSSSLVIACMLFFTGLTTKYYTTAIFLGFTGIFNIFFSTTANSTLQMNSTDEYRGRVMSVYSLVFAGVTPIGNLFSGYVAGSLGASYGFMLSGIITLFLVIVLILTFRRKDKWAVAKHT